MVVFRNQACFSWELLGNESTAVWLQLGLACFVTNRQNKNQRNQFFSCLVCSFVWMLRSLPLPGLFYKTSDTLDSVGSLCTASFCLHHPDQPAGDPSLASHQVKHQGNSQPGGGSTTIITVFVVVDTIFSCYNMCCSCFTRGRRNRVTDSVTA